MRIVLFLSIIIGIFSCNSSNDGNVSKASASNSGESPNFQLTFEGYNSGQVFLIGYYGDQFYRADSSLADANGRVSFVREQPYTPGMYFAVLPTNLNVQVLLDKDQTFIMIFNVNDVVNTMQVEGSIDNQLLYESLRFQNDQAPAFQAVETRIKQFDDKSEEYKNERTKLEALKKEREDYLNGIFTKYPNSLFSSFKRAGQNPDIPEIRNPDGSMNNQARMHQFRTQFWDGVDFSDERLIRTPVINNKLKRFINELTVQNQDSIVNSVTLLMDKAAKYSEYHKFFSNWILAKYDPQKSTLMDPQAVFVHTVQNYLTYEKTSWADSVTLYSLQQRAYEMAASVLGRQGPDVVSTDTEGKTKSIYEIKTPYVVVYMYNPDCEHCMIETPKLVEWYQEWKNKGVEVYAIAVDTEDAKWKNYVNKNNMNFINVHDPTNRSIYAKYYVDHTPELYLLNPERTIVGKNLKVHQVETMINRDKQKRG